MCVCIYLTNTLFVAARKADISKIQLYDNVKFVKIADSSSTRLHLNKWMAWKNLPTHNFW